MTDAPHAERRTWSDFPIEEIELARRYFSVFFDIPYADVPPTVVWLQVPQELTPAEIAWARQAFEEDRP